ncbi:hypothetical protein [Streptomyces glaucus]|uniref:hypothetical protein n=1 Tax=Streptomyces glaucus TaxID=284029 RepID=UPI0031DA8076
MTRSSIRGRPRGTTSHRSVRVAHAVLGGTAGVVWLVLPAVTRDSDVPVAVEPDRPAASAVARDARNGEDDGTSAADLVLPLVTAGAVAVLAGYGRLRRIRRARTRTTPGGAAVEPPVPPLADLDGSARAALVEADDCVRTSREELGFAEARSGAAAVADFARAVREAEAELSAAFRMRQRYDDGLPGEAAARRHALAGIVGRCREAGRRLDAEAGAFDRLRGLAADPGAALEVAEARFRELTGRTGAAQALLADLGGRYAPSATAPVAGYAERATDRLVFATARLNRARQTADAGDRARAAGHLRAAEGAVAQAAVLVAAVGRLAAALATAAALVPAALTGAEAELAGAREGPARAPAAAAEVSADEPRTRIPHADAALAAVREELTGGPYDPLGALRRIVRAVTPLAAGRAGVLPVAALLVARAAAGAAAGFVATHRGAVRAEARTRLAEAERLLAADPPHPLAADALARRARELAEQDVRRHRRPAAEADAVLGGILLGGAPDGGPPPSFGGPRTRARRAAPP